MLTDKQIIDHLAVGQAYIEIDEPDGFVTREKGQWRVARAFAPRHYRTIARCDTLREALDAAITTPTAAAEEAAEAFAQ